MDSHPTGCRIHANVTLIAKYNFKYKSQLQTTIDSFPFQHQQQVVTAVERAKQVTMSELNSIIGVRTIINIIVIIIIVIITKVVIIIMKIIIIR